MVTSSYGACRRERRLGWVPSTHECTSSPSIPTLILRRPDSQLKLNRLGPRPQRLERAALLGLPHPLRAEQGAGRRAGRRGDSAGGGRRFRAERHVVHAGHRGGLRHL